MLPKQARIIGICLAANKPRAREKSANTVSIMIVRQIFEARVFAPESEPHRTDRAVTLFADDNFCLAFIGGIGVVNFVAIDE